MGHKKSWMMLLYFFKFFLFLTHSLSLSHPGLKGGWNWSRGVSRAVLQEQRCLMGQLVERAEHMFPLQFSSSYFTGPRDWLMEFFFFFLNIAFSRPRACLSQPHWTYVHIFPWAVFKCVHPCGCICLVCAPTDLMGPFPWPIASLSLPLAAVRWERL